MKCHIRIKGHLDPSWQDWFEGLEIAREKEGTTLFFGALQDQAALHGILAKMRGLGLEAKVIAAGSKISRVFSRSTLASGEQEELIDPISLLQGLEKISLEPLIWYCPQSRLEPLLLAEVRQRGGDVRYGTELVSFTQDEKGVNAIIK